MRPYTAYRPDRDAEYARVVEYDVSKLQPQVAFPHNPRPPVNQPDFTALANIAGLPAFSLPAGLDEDGMPVAVQLVGPADSDAVVASAARALDLELGGYVSPALD